jgi:hypothetical protein
MRYPMMQSDLLVCVEIDKKMALQRGIVHCHHHPFLVRGHNTSAFHCWRSQPHPSVLTGGLTCKVQAHRVNIHIHS